MEEGEGSSEDTLVKYWNTAGMSSSHIASWWQMFSYKSDAGPFGSNKLTQHTRVIHCLLKLL